MHILATKGFDDYELIDSGNGFRLERFGKYILQRPDPQIIWREKLPREVWQQADAVFERTTEDKGKWVKKNANLPEKWLIQYKNLKFWAKLTPFKHTGIFPEQSLQWEWISSIIENRILKMAVEDRKSSTINILNLFAYTGIASLAAAAAGAKVTHVDASKPTIAWARENQDASGLSQKPIRWIMDDCIKFVTREIKRNMKYDGIIMDPPAFGHGPSGKPWKFHVDFPKLLAICKQVLSDSPLFVIVNAYAISSSSIMLENVLQDSLGGLRGSITSGELCLKEKAGERLLSTGIYARWERTSAV